MRQGDPFRLPVQSVSMSFSLSGPGGYLVLGGRPPGACRRGGGQGCGLPQVERRGVKRTVLRTLDDRAVLETSAMPSLSGVDFIRGPTAMERHA